MKIIFFGSGEFALPTLRALYQHYGQNLVQVVTQPDRPAGRSQLLQATPVKQLALQLKLPVTHTTEQLPEADLAVVVYYGVILTQSVLQHFPLGMLNIHPSLLPRWRGPSPIRSAILANDTLTGVTVMRLDAGMDTGPILKQQAIPLQLQDTNITLEQRLAERGAELLMETLPGYVAGHIQPIAQATEGVTLSKMVRKADGELHPTMTHQAMWNSYRAMQPWPGVFFKQDGKRYKITDARWENDRLYFDRIQPEGKQPMALADFKRGYPSVLFADII